jgi:spore maturation protein B
MAILAGALRGVAVYDAFVEGAKRGLKTAVGVAPYLCAALLLIGLVRSSGLLSLLMALLAEPLRALGLPEGTLPLMIMRPVSGSASLAVLEDILATYGADSTTARVAAAMMGSTETVLYTVAVYMGAAGVKKSRGIVPVALFSSLVGAVAAGVAVQLFF